MPNFENAFNTVCELVKDFKENENTYLSHKYNEQQARKDFIDKFFIALGWDVNHNVQKNPHKQEVLIEQTLDNQRRPDYTFYLEPNFNEPKFFVEAKKPSHDLLNSDYYFQAISYARFANTPVTVLTDFQEFHILDSRYKPNINTVLKDQNHLVFKYTDYADREKFAQIYYLFSRDDVANNSIKDYADKLTASDKKRKKSGYTKGELLSIDEEFLLYLDNIRVRLAKAFKKSDSSLSSEELTEATQRTIDRLVFIRFLEDKNIEPEDFVSKLGTSGKAWSDFISVCRKLDAKYNGIVFKEHFIDNQNFGGPELSEFKNVCYEFSRKNPQSFNYNLIPIHILGSIYERFLGKVVNATAQRVKVEEKPEVRKAGGVYYTPKYIVDYIVDNTVGKILRNENETLPRWRGIKGVEEDDNISSVSSPLALGGYLNNGNPEDGKDNTPLVPKLQLGNGKGLTPAQISKLRFADIACGSGSFLIGVFETLLDYHNNYYWLHQEEAKKDGCIFKDGVPFLSIKQKQNILLNNIYGVDIDPQAVEVTQLSLALKMLEDESLATANEMQVLFHEKILPDLSKNIICGNSLIGTDIIYEESTDGLFERKRRITIEEERKLNPMDFEKRFPHIFKSPPLTGDKGGGSINPSLSSPLAKQTHEVLLGGDLKNTGHPLGHPEYKGGFDAIVGNPPYGATINTESKKYLSTKYNSVADYETSQYFISNANNLLKGLGRLGYIVPNTMLLNIMAKRFRELIVSQYSINKVVNLSEIDVFQGATVRTVILLCHKQMVSKGNIVEFCEFEGKDIVTKNTIIQENLNVNDELWISSLDFKNNLSIRDSILKNTIKLKDILTVSQGLIPYDKYRGHDEYTIKNRIWNADYKKDETYRKELRGGDVSRYFVKWNGKQWISYGNWLAAPRKKEYFTSPRLLFREITDPKTGLLHVAYTEEEYYNNPGLINCISNDNNYSLFFILGIVNSKLISYYHFSSSPKANKGVFPKILVNDVRNLPVKTINFQNESEKQSHDRIVSLVNEMLEAKKQLQTAKTDRDKTYYENKCTDLDHAIDSEVYKLYGLTEEEIKIVEGRE